MRIILASGSPRRQELLQYIVPEFEIVPSAVEEIASGTPEQQVLKLAQDKAQDVAAKHPDAVVIGADTLVALGELILGKPSDEAEAADMLKKLSGKTHQVYTGIAVIGGGRTDTEYVVTDVTFHDISPDEIAAYIKTREPMDKAGAYGIQGYGGKFIRSISGCYFNVMGLPQSTVYRMLQQAGALIR